MRRLFALLFAILLPCCVFAQSMGGKPFLSVQGHAETTVKPDIFPLEVTLSDTGLDGAKSQKVVEDLAQLVLREASRLKLADVDIEIGNLSVSPETKWDDKQEQDIFLGNEYRREITLRFHDLGALRGFIGAMPDSRNVRLATQTFEFSGKAELQRKLRREAIDDARRGAEEMASAVGKRLVELQNVSDRPQSTVYSASGYDSEGLQRVTVVGSGTRRRSSDIILREGEIKVSADAFLVYVIGD